MLTYSVPVLCFAAYLPLAAGALLARPFIGSGLAGTVLALAVAPTLLVLGLVVPLSVRFARARRELRSWRANGEPPEGRPSDKSLPTVADAVLGLALGAIVGAPLALGALIA